MKELPPLKTLNGKFDAYCHVCWQAIYGLWVSSEDPRGLCPFGATVVTDCSQAMDWERLRADLIKSGALT